MTTKPSPKALDEYMVEVQKQAVHLVVQPRMGFSPFAEMFNGIAKVRDFDAGPRAATATIDAKTRQNKYVEAEAALAKGIPTQRLSNRYTWSSADQ